MRGSSRIGVLSALVALAISSGLPPAAAAPAGCAQAPPAAAARSLVHPHAEVVALDRVAGFDSALVLEPLIHPGVRHRLIRAGYMWCEASGLNAAWRLDGRAADEEALARAFVQIAGAAHFDHVTVRRAVSVRRGVFVLETHALTNGVRALWTVVVDAQGVRTARWTATGFALRPFVAEIEGLTALPGLERSYSRSPSGAVLAREPMLPAVSMVPEAIAEGFTADDFLIRISTSESKISPNAGQDTGVLDVDLVRAARDVAVSNYNQFHSWGFRKGWDSNLGMIWIDNGTGAQCLACVVRSATFNIHMSSQVLRALEALGFTYPDQRKALATVIGHEMYHNWQNAYGKPDFNQRSSAFSEGTARMQETAHDYSDVSHQPGSLIYSTGREIPGVSLAANSCNGWDGADRNASFAAGPFTGKSYNACYFWLTWYGTHGPAGQVALLTAMKEAQKVGGIWPEQKAGIEAATGQPIVGDLAAFASATLTGHGYTWGPGAGGGTPIDWGVYLDRWQPPGLAAGGTATATLTDGGMLARGLSSAGYPSVNKITVALAIVRSSSAGAEHELIQPGTCVDAPADGESLWAVAIYPRTGSTSVTMKMTPLAEGVDACPEEEPI